MFLLLVDSKKLEMDRAAWLKSENHHGNGDPDLMERAVLNCIWLVRCSPDASRGIK